MVTIIKHPTVVIKCSNAEKSDKSITCMAVESNTKQFPVNMIWIYSNTEHLSKEEFLPSNLLQSTLADTLDYFPLLAGRVTEDDQANATIHLNNEGVLYTEAECPDHSLDYFIPRTASNQEFDYEHINTSDLAVGVNNDWTGASMSIQVTRLKCQSVILSISAFHCLFDAQSIAFFINTWASGKPPSPMPMFDKTFILYPTEEQRQRISSVPRPKDCVFNRHITPSAVSPFIQRYQKQRVITKVYHFSTDELQNIKREASKGLSKSVDYITTYDALYAHMILVISRATGTSFNDGIKILQSLNGRPSFVGSQSSTVLNYLGSFPFWLYEIFPSDEEATLSSLAEFIHQMYSKKNEDSLRDYNAYLMSEDGDIRKNQADADILNRDFHCASWRKVNMLACKFPRSDYPIYSGPTSQLYPRYFPMMDANSNDQSVNILLGLREEDYQRMIEQNLLHQYQ